MERSERNKADRASENRNIRRKRAICKGSKGMKVGRRVGG